MEWFGWRRRKIEIDVHDDVVLFAAMRPKEQIASKRVLRRLERRKLRPGRVLIKYFRNIASGDLKALFPNIQVVMSDKDKLMLGVPALGERHSDPDQSLHHHHRAVPGARLLSRRHRSVEDKDIKTALAALSAAHRARRLHHAAVHEISAAVAQISEGADRQHLFSQHQQQCRHFRLHHRRRRGTGIKEAFLAYHFLHVRRAADRRPNSMGGSRNGCGRASASTWISTSTTRSTSWKGSACSGATANGSSSAVRRGLQHAPRRVGQPVSGCVRAEQQTLFAQISRFDFRVVAQRLGAIGADNVAVIQQIAAVGDGQALLGILLDQKDAHAALLDARERAEQFAA